MGNHTRQRSVSASRVEEPVLAELIDWSGARQEVELLFLTLEEGCQVEDSQLGRIERAPMLFLIIA